MNQALQTQANTSMEDIINKAWEERDSVSAEDYRRST